MIEIIGLHKKIDSKVIFNDLYLEILDGEIMAIIGRSGAGKTLLLKHIVGILKPDKGKILVDGEDITEAKGPKIFKIREKFGYVFQNSALFDSLTVYENLKLPLRERGLKENEINEKIQEILEILNLKGVEKLYPYQLSGGMQKRVSFARAFITKPKYILYDEPTTGLDPIVKETINDLILELKRIHKSTGILVTHDLKCALKVADRLSLLDNGKIEITVTTKDFLENRKISPQLEKFFKYYWE